MSAVIVPDQIIDEVDDYGPIGAAFVLSVWVVALTAIMVVGSLAGAVIAERRLGHEPVHANPSRATEGGRRGGQWPPGGQTRSSGAAGSSVRIEP